MSFAREDEGNGEKLCRPESECGVLGKNRGRQKGRKALHGEFSHKVDVKDEQDDKHGRRLH